VPWWTWIGLAFFAGVLVVAVAVALVGLRRLSRLQASAEGMTAAFEELTARAEALERRAMAVEENRARLEEHFGRLDRSRERLGVLTWALRDATKDLAGFRNLLRK
jgi:hypothetical protein